MGINSNQPTRLIKRNERKLTLTQFLSIRDQTLDRMKPGFDRWKIHDKDTAFYIRFTQLYSHTKTFKQPYHKWLCDMDRLIP